MNALLDLSPVALSALLAPFGLILGSFCNVLIHRLPLEQPEDRNVVTKPSHCPHCGTRIRWVHNLPLVSWLWLRGRCAHCGASIPFRYFLVELLGGVLLGGLHWVAPVGSLIWLKLAVAGFALLVLFYTDFTEFILPDVIQFPLMALGVLFALPQEFWPGLTHRIVQEGYSLLTVDTLYNGLQPAPAWTLLGAPVTWTESLIGLVGGYGAPWLLATSYVLFNNQILVRFFGRERIEEGMGMGDFKLLAWIGAFWGWQTMLGVFAIGVILGGLLGIFLWVFRKGGARTLLPFGCPLAIAVPVAVFWGRGLWDLYLSTLG